MSVHLLHVFIGYDSREDVAYQVAIASMMRRSTIPLHITTMNEAHLRATGMFWRPQRLAGPGHGVDLLDGRPFSTAFAFTRFLVPELMGFKGWALFSDCDFLWRGDVQELFALRDPKYAVQVVKHDHRPTETVKMDGVRQASYPRKNWSSLILWNCGHEANRVLDLQAVNRLDGRELHGFSWLNDFEIGGLPVEWNWLEGVSDPDVDPKAVHYTRGGPWFKDYVDTAFADEWRRELVTPQE